MPTNKRVIDPYSWSKNFKIKQKSTVVVDADPGTMSNHITLSYNKLLLLFTYKDVFQPDL
jgi:hypothetical protein